MPAMNAVSFTDPYAAEQAEIERRRRMAEMLQAQGAQGLGGTEVVGGWAIPRSPLEGLGKAVQQVSGAYQEKQASEMAKALRERAQGDFNADRGALVAAMQGRPADPGVDDPTAGYAPPAPAQAPNPQAIRDMQFRSPMFQQMQMQQMIAQLQPKAPIKAGPGDQLIDPTTFKPVYSVPQKPDKPPAVPSAIQEYEYAQKQGFKGSFQDFQIAQRRAGAPNVSVKTDVKTGESLAGQVGPMMKDSTTAAEGAVKQVDAARRIVQAVDSSKMISGPTAGVRLTVAQMAQTLGIGGKNEAEKIANTRQAVRGLAELTLQGRQQMRGQGAITESEGKLAEKAMSGEIDMTAAEIRQLAKASERAARFNYSEHQRKMKVMQENPDLRQIAPFYQGPAMPAEDGAVTPQGAAQPRIVDW